jgi:hypothetical protein
VLRSRDVSFKEEGLLFDLSDKGVKELLLVAGYEHIGAQWEAEEVIEDSITVATP